MTLHPSLRPRVERLLRGEFQSEDLTRLFLAVRERNDGRESVKEVGDFAAHQGEKYKGIVTREVRDFFTVIRFQHPLNVAKSALSMPANAGDYFYAAFRRLDSKVLRADTGLPRLEAQELLPSIIAKLHTNLDGTVAITRDYTPKEIDLVQCLLRRIVVKPAFTANRLFDDFRAALRLNCLLLHGEEKTFRSLFATIALYTVSLMHKSTIDLGDGTYIALAASTHWGKIAVQSHIQMPADPQVNGTVLIASNIFETELDPNAYCEPDLLPPLWSSNEPWPFGVEVNANRKLAPLR
jgi:hypothetical protein